MESLDLGVRGDDGDTGTLLTITSIDGSVESKKKIFLVPYNCVKSQNRLLLLIDCVNHHGPSWVQLKKP